MDIINIWQDTKKNMIICGNSLEVLKTFPSEFVDAVVIDPPFGIGKNYCGGKELFDNPEDYWKWLQPIYVEHLRCLKPGGFVAIWQTQKYFPYFWDWFGKDIHIYIGAKNFVQIRKKTPITFAYDPVVM